MRSIVQKIYKTQFYYRWRRNQIWKALADLELKLIGPKNLKIPPDVEYMKYSGKLKTNQTHDNFLIPSLIKFLNSKPIDGCVYGEQLMLVSGPDRIGKSTFIRNAIDEFKKTKQAEIDSNKLEEDYNYMAKLFATEKERALLDRSDHMIIQIDHGTQKNMSFNAFIHQFEQKLVQEITIKTEQYKGTKKTLLNHNTLLRLALQDNHPRFIRIHAKDVVQTLLNDCSERLLTQDSKDKLLVSKILQPTSQVSTKSLQTQLKQIATVIMHDQKCSEIKAALTLYMLIFKQIQYEYRPEEYTNSYYRTGIETTNFLLRILDFLVGVVDFNKGDYISPVQVPGSNEFLNAYYKQDITSKEYFEYARQPVPLARESPLQPVPLPTTCIEKGEHIDVCLVFLNIFQLTCSKDMEFLNWYDNIVLRSSNKSGMRKGVPILIELHHSTNVEDVFKLGALQPENPLIIDIAGYRLPYFKNTIWSMLPAVKEVFQIWNRLGHHPEVWKDICLQLEGKGKYIQDVLTDYDGLDVTKRDRIIAKSLINQAFTNPKALQTMHLPQFRFRMIQILEELYKKRAINIRIISSRLFYIDENIASQTLVESGLFFNAFYEEILAPNRFTYRESLRQQATRLKKNYRLRYWFWILTNGFQFTYMKTKYPYQYFADHVIRKGLPRSIEAPHVVPQNRILHEAYLNSNTGYKVYHIAQKIHYGN